MKVTLTPISPQAFSKTLEKRAQLIGVEGEKDGAGNETRTRDPDLGKIVPQSRQDHEKTRESGFDKSCRNAQVNRRASETRSARREYHSAYYARTAARRRKLASDRRQCRRWTAWLLDELFTAGLAL